MSRQIPVTLTNMCMVYDGDKILVQDRADPNWPGVIFPGGHVESGESFAAAVIREVYEETGLHIKNPRLCGIKEWENSDGSRYIVLLYKTNQYSGEIKSSDEGNVFWTTFGALSTAKLSEHFLEVAEIFRRDDLSEFFYNRTNEGWEIQLL